jgi:hypothetical protein
VIKYLFCLCPFLLPWSDPTAFLSPIRWPGSRFFSPIHPQAQRTPALLRPRGGGRVCGGAVVGEAKLPRPARCQVEGQLWCRCAARLGAGGVAAQRVEEGEDGEALDRDVALAPNAVLNLGWCVLAHPFIILSRRVAARGTAGPS